MSSLLWIPLGGLLQMVGNRLPWSAGGGITGQELHFLKFARGCTLDNCLDWAKCRNSTSFYIYRESEGNIEPALLQHFGDRKEIYRFMNMIEKVIRLSPDLSVTDDPSKACFFVPRLACLSVGKCDLYEGFAEARLKALPYWNGGHNHILVDYADDRFTKIYGGGAELHIRSGSSSQFFRPGYDISVPLRPKMSLYGRTVTTGKPAADRPLLVSFRGSLTDESAPHIQSGFTRGTTSNHKLRRQLASLNDDEKGDIVVQVGDLDRSRLKESAYWSDFGSLLLDSKFQLVPRGKGLHSHRLLESLAAGSIPVLLADGYVLPFDDIIDWSNAIVRVAEAEWRQIPKILRALLPRRIHELQCNCLFIYRNFFMRPGGSLEIAFRQLQERVMKHHNYLGERGLSSKPKAPTVLREWPPTEISSVEPPPNVPFCETGRSVSFF
jgi:glucuronyl/N-acetylglucosaminyl transferase EXT1